MSLLHSAKLQNLKAELQETNLKESDL